jgi:hypothetical protein
MTDQNKLADDLDLEKSPEASILHPGYTYKGLTVKPLTMGSKLIFYRLIANDDNDSFFACTLIYILSRPRAEIEPLSRDLTATRVKIYDWIDEQKLNEADLEQARALTQRILDDAKAGEVRVVNDSVDSLGKI